MADSKDPVQFPLDPSLPASTPLSPRSLDETSLRRYATRLSEVVMQQHTARRKDWAAWHAREEKLAEEVRDLRQEVFSEQQAREEALGREAILEQELRAERRRRIDLEAKVTLADTWKTEALAADRAAKITSANAALQASVESEAAREWKRQAIEYRQAEAKCAAKQHQAEVAAQQARQALTRHVDEQKEKDQTIKLQESEVLTEAWRVSGELRSELHTVARQSPYGGSTGEVLQNGSAARQALHDLREVRLRYTSLLDDLPG
eukprot:TRINITY_DN40679_c0_g1_i1.p1 TRINITY_DN40679_c0_g1~~TRINITY_DN40679_c0_g1_i1.p1  ORF type:complete len:263 (+),score=67.21 TRINITY_DN40679_c0_g1_i1:175-963(+)